MHYTYVLQSMKDVLKKKAQILFNRVNMVRARVVSHPSERTSSGYNEIQKPRNRYGLIDHQSLMNLLNIDNHEDLKAKGITSKMGRAVLEGIKPYSRE